MEANIKKDNKKLSLITVIVLGVGNVVGIGIFFKNSSIFKINQNNGWGVFTSWVIGFVIALSIAMSLIEIVSAVKKNSDSGLAGWIEIFLGKKVGKYIHFFIPLIYFSFVSFSFSIFTAESIFAFFYNTFTGSSIITCNFGFIALGSVVIWLIILSCNVFASNLSYRISKHLTYVKYVPIILIVFVGIVFAILKGQSGYFSVGGNDIGKYSPVLIFSCLPAVLFSFDGFSSCACISARVINPEKNINKSIIYIMLIIGCTYLLVTLSLILTGAPTIADLIAKIVPNKNAQITFNALVWALIIVDCFVTCNSFTIVSINAADSCIKEKYVYKHEFFQRVNSKNALLGAGISVALAGFVFSLIFYIPSIIYNTDQLIDIGTNANVEIMFIFYCLLLVFSIINRFRKKVIVKKNKYHLFFCIIALIGCSGAVLFSSIHTFIYEPFAHPNGTIGWGLFMANTTPLKNSISSILFWIIILAFSGIPIINILLNNKNNNLKQAL